MKPEAALEEAGRALRAAGTAARASSEEAYLKSKLRFYGTPMADLRRIAKAHPELDRRGLRALAEAAWKQDVYELRSFTLALLDRRRACSRSAICRGCSTLLMARGPGRTSTGSR